jgi:hypothetical protein
MILFYKYKILIENVNKVIFLKDLLNNHLNNRFKLFEELIYISNPILNYEQTIFKDIVKLRAIASSAKYIGDELTQYEAEWKISQLVLKLDLIINEYPTLNDIEGIERLKDRLNQSEKNLSLILREYNENILKFKADEKTLALFIFERLNKKCKIKCCLWKV